MSARTNYHDPRLISRVVSIVSRDYPELSIGYFVGVLEWEGRSPLVKTSNGRMLVTTVAMEDVDFHQDIPEYSNFMASTFEKD